MSNHVIAIDFGGTKIEGSIVDKKGKIGATKRVSTEAKKGKDQILKNIIAVINHLKSNFNKNIKGVGISLPGFIDKKGRLVFGGGTLTCLVGVNLKRELERRTKLPVFLENDANCFALAEAVYGAGKNHGIVLGVIWGTGIGGGIIINKHVYSGSFGGAGEFGHMVIDPTIIRGPKCGCGQYACLEMLSSGKNIARLYKKKGGKIKTTHVKAIYESKERASKEVIDDAIHYLGVGLANIVNVLNPDIIVLGGGVSKLPDVVYKKLEREVCSACVDKEPKDCQA